MAVPAAITDPSVMPLPARRSEEGLRVIEVIDTLGSGGAETALAAMLPGFLAAGIAPIVVCLARRDEGPGDAVEAMVAVHYLRARSRIGRVGELRQLIRHLRPDLVHTTLFEATICGRLAAAATGTPVLTSLVNDSYGPQRYADPGLRRWRLRAVQLVDAITARRLTDHHHAITRAVRSAAVDQLGLDPGDITVIPRGHDPARIPAHPARVRARTRRQLGIPEDAPVVLTVGRQEYQKGHADLLRASARLCRDRHDLHVLVAGREGNATPALVALHAELGLDHRVRLLGYRTDVIGLLAAADVFVFPSRFEGLGNALLEALMMQLPVVASDIPAIREVVGPELGGGLVKPGRWAALAETIDELLDDPVRRQRDGRLGRERFLAQFTLDRTVERHVALYHQVAGGPGTKARARRQRATPST